MTLIIDCHGHFTTEPQKHHDFRKAQVAFAEGRVRERPAYPGISDEELYAIIEANQLKLQKERGSDLTIISPRASGMGHHIDNVEIAGEWARISNDNVKRIVDLFPENFAGVCQLPQTVDGDLRAVIAELERCVAQGFVGCNLNPDPSGGRWSAPPIYDEWWDPLWEAMVGLDVPAMIHVSGSCERCLHTTGAHYINADTAVFMQLIQGDLFERHPRLRLIIPHGGGAAPYHWGRYRGLSIMLEKPPLTEHLMNNLFFDTCVYHQAGIDTLFRVVDKKNILFGAELLGAVKAVDPETGHSFDDTKRYIDALGFSAEDRHAIFEGNARRAYPLLDKRLKAQNR
ncbi:amidohydrolase family protein [Sinorhizobium alkalisoli]|uniref:4-oxalomesaconate hydratase n=1 Tax=Sinorhizobium alkalisoli TaxID=1752398 RepID=A0A1E3VIP4_9HYPH|nr:amidohydrolase family protein [Sinorhizobium alkalisoli]MCG5478669.1 amidohydrolase family protein [Sinorhizobium alkalisoli]ODR93101.1 4-oxalomesaconate hydratase [Sinorhizobium alkalisoli]